MKESVSIERDLNSVSKQRHDAHCYSRWFEATRKMGRVRAVHAEWSWTGLKKQRVALRCAAQTHLIPAERQRRLEPSYGFACPPLPPFSSDAVSWSAAGDFPLRALPACSIMRRSDSSKPAKRSSIFFSRLVRLDSST